MVAKGSRDRRSSSSANTMNGSTTSTKRRLPSATQEKKKIAKPIGICGFCLGDNEKNGSGVPEEMINCAECGNSGHPSCLQYSEKLVAKIKTIHWQCIDCKRCIVCNKGDDSLLFCDFCDCGIHPKCCDPPLNTIPKGDFSCHLCRDDKPSAFTPSPSKTLLPTLSSSSSSSSAHSRRSNQANDTETPAVISRPVAQLIDGMSNFFLPNKLKVNTTRHHSVQKAMKFLREKKPNQLLKRLHSSNLNGKTTKENLDLKHELLAKSILASSKLPRIRKKPTNLDDDVPPTPQTSTPVLTRPSLNRKPLVIEPITPRPIRRSDIQSVEESSKATLSRSIGKRKHSANSISPISTASLVIKKRSRNDSPMDKSRTKNSIKKRKESKTEDSQPEEDDDDEDTERASDVSKRKLNLDLSKYKNSPAFLNDSLPSNIAENDVYLFLDARKNSERLINECSDQFDHANPPSEDDANSNRWPPYIVLGPDLIKTWYSSSYPQEYARVPRLYICEFCLKYMKCEQVYDRHRKNCPASHPPANEIYHKDDLSVFEVDGNINRIYCQNLCLLAKLFLDHKTLYYDVEPFLFYVLTRNDAHGCHFIGYFSKEKHCPQKYNLSCITVLPNCQRRGYGRFLIALSYLLSQKEGQMGTPERPLSTLGAQTYEAYWKIKIIEQLLLYYNENKSKCVLKTIMNETGMAIDDIIDTLQNLGVLTMKSNGRPAITVNVATLEATMQTEKVKHAHWVSLDGEFLRFTPVLTLHLLSNEEKAIEKQMKEIQIVFKEIGRDAAEAATLASTADAADGSNGTEGVRYVRRRKFGQKRRSIYVKRRVPINQKPDKNESIITHDDSTAREDNDEHSQEYISRRRISTIDESEHEAKEEIPVVPVVVVPSPPKPPPKQTIFKQLKLDQFLKVVRPSSADVSSSFDDTLKSTSASAVPGPEKSSSDAEFESANENDEQNPLDPMQTTRSPSESESVPTTNETSSVPIIEPDLDRQDSLTRQISDGAVSTVSSDDSSVTLGSSSISNIDRPLPLKKRAWTLSNVPAVVNPPASPLKTADENTAELSILNREVSVATTTASDTPSSLSDILANPFLRSTSSTNGTDDETKIARIESQLKTVTAAFVEPDEQIPLLDTFEATIKPVEFADDEPPPSLTSPTSMIVSQSDHYNYSSRSKQPPPHQQTITINNFHASTDMTYNFGNASFPYSYPPAAPIDMSPFYYPSPSSMNYMPYYPAAPYPGPSAYPPGSHYGPTTDPAALYYPSNGVHSVPYNGNGTAPYMYPAAQPSSTAPATQRH